MDGITSFVGELPYQQIFFMLFGALAVAGALMVVLQRSPLNSALSLIVTFVGITANYVLLKAQFLAAIQIIVYAGAIIVLFMFVIMLLSVRNEESRLERNTVVKWMTVPCALAMLAVLIYAMREVRTPANYQAARSVRAGTSEIIGRELFTTYLLPFEATSVLIIMAIVGAIVLARRADAPGTDEAVEAPMPEEVIDAVAPVDDHVKV